MGDIQGRRSGDIGGGGGNRTVMDDDDFTSPLRPPSRNKWKRKMGSSPSLLCITISKRKSVSAASHNCFLGYSLARFLSFILQQPMFQLSLIFPFSFIWFFNGTVRSETMLVCNRNDGPELKGQFNLSCLLIERLFLNQQKRWTSESMTCCIKLTVVWQNCFQLNDWDSNVQFNETFQKKQSFLNVQ